MVQFKRLRLSGFKSFVEPTELEIGPGLTGIVGPNGCGKSNLVEALRWVMGENSPKRMRSSGMNDVIFAGTEKRPARNTAEVLLQLDNTDRTAPAEINDSDDLDVSRKIERDVGSTYKVNGKTVRMRDVQLLFADSSIGAHSPALVSQGRVADMINAKPQQRRMVLEEAAGISGLHARRHEAELKLRAAEKNLTRVDDVINALDVQLGSLKKQARQANRYRNLSGHIAIAEGSLLYLRWQDSATAVDKALTAFEAAEDIVRGKTLVVTELTTKQTEAAAHLPDLRKAEAEAAAALQHLKLVYGGLETEERQVQEEQKKSEELLEQFTADVTHENLQKQEAETHIERLDSEYQNLRHQAENQTTRETEAETGRDEKKNVVGNLEVTLTALTEETARIDAQRNSADRRITELTERLGNLTTRKTRLETEYAEIIANTPAKAELETLERSLTQAEETCNTAATTVDTAETERNAADTQVTGTTEYLQDVQKAYDELMAESTALSRILKNTQEGYQPVALQTNVESGLEKALAVALGDDLQAALDGDAPMYWRELPEYATTESLPHGARALTEFVRAPRALNRTLSQIGLVDNEETATRLMTDLKPGQCLVTRSGGAWRWDGLVVSPDAENPAAVRLEQKNRLAEVEAELETRAETLKSARFAVENARTRRTAAVETLQAARQALRDAEENLKTLRREHGRLTEALGSVTAKLSSLATSIENTTTEIEETQARQNEVQALLETLPDTTENREEISSLKTELAEKRESLATAEAIWADIRREGERRTRRLDYITSEKEEWTVRIARGEMRLTELAERIDQAQETLTRLAERPAEIEAEKQGLMTRISDAETKRQEAADTLVTSETTVNDLQRDLRAAESTLSDARESRAMAQANVSTTQHTQNSIAAQIEEKFTCTAEKLLEKLEIDPEKLADLETLQKKYDRLIRERENMGPVNLRAEVEAEEILEKVDNMTAERDDLVAAIDKLREGINKLNKEARERLLNAFDVVNKHFQTLFTRLFSGGQAYLKLIDAEDPLEAGLEIFAQPPGKKLQVLSLLSGGEQTLTSIALIFAMFLTNPAPICVLDEVDAPLDESNVDRYCTLLEELAKECETRFIIVTHHRLTMARMDRLYGVTMGEKGISQLVSVDLTQPELLLDEAA